MLNRGTVPIVSFLPLLPFLAFASGCVHGAGNGPGNLAAAAMAGAPPPGPLGTLTGGELGTGNGYLVGAERQKVERGERQEAIVASHQAEQHPAGVGDVRRSDTADLNRDGFVTLDEILAMKRAGLNDAQMIDRLRRTNHVFELTREQQRYLTQRGVSRNVVEAMVRPNAGTGSGGTEQVSSHLPANPPASEDKNNSAAPRRPGAP